MWIKGNQCVLLVQMWIGAATKENSMQVPQKIKNRTTSNFTPAYSIEENEKDRCAPIFIAALSTIAKIWKQPKCPFICE